LNEVIIEAGNFREVLGSYPTGVSVITAMSAQGSPIGMVVGTFTSVSLDPPLVGFLPARTSTTWPQIEATGHFCVNVLGSDQTALCRQMASPGDKFAGVEFAVTNHGLPQLPGVIAAIECRIHSVVEAGDHVFVLGTVLRLDALRNGDPMLFHRGRYGGFAELG
jgi:flavin reductase (DIM6/NTAB) family NADH-FMN oxidoreductase RutF